MMVFGIFALLVASVAARGSGPYLPRGWKPDGPAFYLPVEVAKPKQNPVKVDIFQESEASSSDSLREYGPPKVEVEEISFEFSKQGLPDAVTEQTFAFVELKVDQVGKQKAVTESQVFAEDSEAKLSEQSFVQEIAPVTEALENDGRTTLSVTQFSIENTEIQIDIEVTTEVNEVNAAAVENKTEDDQQVFKVETEQQDPEAKPEQDAEFNAEQLEELKVEEQAAVNDNQGQDVKAIQLENENANSDLVSTIDQGMHELEILTVQEDTQKDDAKTKGVETEQKVETQVKNFDTGVKTVEQLVQNIPEVLINIDKENKEKRVENLEQLPETKIVLEGFGSLEQAPEGFLEYGPPGFTEYGPPKDDVLKSISEEISPELQSIESNEARKRRYSPKFRIARKANRH